MSTPTQLALPVVTLPAHRAPRLPAGTRDGNSILKRAEGFIGTYKFTLNPYVGCRFACDYCYARAFAPSQYLRDTWGDWVDVKRNAVEHLQRARSARRCEANRLMPGDTIYMSSVTDPYQPIEAKAEVTRAALQSLLPLQPRLTIQTRSPLVTRDIELLRQFKAVRVNMTITTDDESVRRRYEPACPPIEARFAVLDELLAASIPVGVSIAPILPLLDPEAFGRRLASLRADEYCVLRLKTTTGGFRGGTPLETARRARDDGWFGPRVDGAVEAIREALSPVPLLEGDRGFQPPG